MGNLPTPADVFIHPRALCESAAVGAGTRVWAFAHVMEGALVGEGCNICDHAFVESGARLGNRVTLKNAALVWDGVVLEDDVFVGPHAAFTNVSRPRVGHKRDRRHFERTWVRRGATIGANTTILCGLTIGERAFVGAGAVVTRDVAPYALVVGAPAARVGWACECGLKLPPELCCVCGKAYELIDERRGLRPSRA